MPVASGVSVLALVKPSLAGSGRWRDLGVRTASAAVLLPLALGCLWAGGWAWTVLIVLAALGMGWEWHGLVRHRPSAWFAAAGVPYIVPAAAALLALRAHGPMPILFVLCVVWASDIGAYTVGRLVGGPKLAPAISPGKTRSGAVGGLLAAVCVGFAAAWLDGGRYGIATAVAAVLGVAAQAGDLFESWIKRRVGVKDSGHLIPGHGGLLDRLDAVLFAAPAAALLVAGRGVELWR
jgi:phosphatidate cytidylyltransferase